MDPLTYLMHIETCREIIETLTPTQLTVAALRWDGLTDVVIAELLGVRRQLVGQRIYNARERLMREWPELAPMIAGRSFRRKMEG